MLILFFINFILWNTIISKHRGPSCRSVGPNSLVKVMNGTKRSLCWMLHYLEFTGLIFIFCKILRASVMNSSFASSICLQNKVSLLLYLIHFFPLSILFGKCFRMGSKSIIPKILVGFIPLCEINHNIILLDNT